MDASDNMGFLKRIDMAPFERLISNKNTLYLASSDKDISIWRLQNP